MACSAATTSPIANTCGSVTSWCSSPGPPDSRPQVPDHQPHGRHPAYGEPRAGGRPRPVRRHPSPRTHEAPKPFRWQWKTPATKLWASAVWRVPNTKEARNLARRFEKHGHSYIRFISSPDIDPTTILLEQAIRFVVLDRHVTQGTCGEVGQHWSERVFVIATCTQQTRDLFSFLRDSVTAFFQGKPSPTLEPNSS